MGPFEKLWWVVSPYNEVTSLLCGRPPFCLLKQKWSIQYSAITQQQRREVTALISNHTLCRAMLLSSLQFSSFSATKSGAASGTALSTLDPKIPVQRCLSPSQTGSSLKHLTSGATHERNNFLLKSKHESPRGGGDGRWWRSRPALED